jgi:hypothetical protein
MNPMPIGRINVEVGAMHGGTRKRSVDADLQGSSHDDGDGERASLTLTAELSQAFLN